MSGYFMKQKTLENTWGYAEDTRVYAYGKADGVTDRHEIYDAMGKESGARQRAYREYVCSNRDREEQEIREKMVRGVIGAEIFQEKIEKRVMEVRRPKRGRPRK